MDFLWAFCRAFAHTWQRSLVLTRAGSLTFSSILAIVPLMIVGVALLSILPIATQVQTAIQDFIFRNFIASSGQQIQTYVSFFVSRAWQMSWWGIGFLAVNAIGILLALEQSLNAIWQVPSRGYLPAILLYSVVLIVMPLLMTVSIGLSLLIENADLVPTLLLPLSKITSKITVLWPLLFSFMGYLVIFKGLPHTRVSWKAAAFGAFWTAVFFEVAKHAFTWYVQLFPSYERIYGAVVAVPLFFLWLYCCWLILFCGAVLAYVWQTRFHQPT